MTNKKDKDFARARLAEMLKPGDRIATSVMHVSRSGLSRSIGLQIAIIEDGKPRVCDISWQVAAALGWRFDNKNGGVSVSGCGMDMCFHTVYTLGRVLFPDGFGLIGTKNGKKRRAASRKSAAAMVRNGWEFRGRNGDGSGWDRDGGYALDYRG